MQRSSFATGGQVSGYLQKPVDHLYVHIMRAHASTHNTLSTAWSAAAPPRAHAGVRARHRLGFKRACPARMPWAATMHRPARRPAAAYIARRSSHHITAQHSTWARSCSLRSCSSSARRAGLRTAFNGASLASLAYACKGGEAWQLHVGACWPAAAHTHAATRGPTPQPPQPPLSAQAQA